MSVQYRQLPIRVRPGRRESAESYLRRLLAANALPDSLDRYLRPRHDDQARRHDLITQIAEEMGGLPRGVVWQLDSVDGHDDGSTCAGCFVGFDDRSTCRLCGGGESYPQYLNTDALICRKHLIWIGPDSGQVQEAVDASMVRVDRKYRRLRRQGLAPAILLSELASAAGDWAEVRGDRRSVVRNWAIAVELLGVIASPQLQAAAFGPDVSFRDGYAHLDTAVARLRLPERTLLVDRLWVALRPSVLRLYERSQGVERLPDPHEYRFAFAPRGEYTTDIRAYFEPLRTCWPSEWADFAGTRLQPDATAACRGSVSKHRTMPTRFICAAGHRLELAPKTLAAALERGTEGCRYCAGQNPYHGDSLLEVAPHLAGEFDLERNAPLRPESLRHATQRRVWWQCEAGHPPYQMSLRWRAEGGGCKYCVMSAPSPRKRGARLPSLAVVHPELIAEWSPRNNATPFEISTGSGFIAWWTCQAGHEYRARAYFRHRGTGCPICTNKRVVAGVNDLATLFPTLASEWHPELNDILPTDVVPGSNRKAHWLCPRGHTFTTRIVARTKHGVGCPQCPKAPTRRRIKKLHDVDPAIAALWHQAQNHPTRIEDLPSSGATNYFWLCGNGHTFESNISRIRRNGGRCPTCQWRLRSYDGSVHARSVEELTTLQAA